jgi:hypothetical protein
MGKKDKLLKLYNEVKRIAREHRCLGSELDYAIKEFYGKHYGEINWLKDNDWIIDSLDYGTSDLSFDKFDKLMKSKSFNEAIEIDAKGAKGVENGA